MSFKLLPTPPSVSKWYYCWCLCHKGWIAFRSATSWSSRSNTNWMLVLNHLKSPSSLHRVNAHLRVTLVLLQFLSPSLFAFFFFFLHRFRFHSYSGCSTINLFCCLGRATSSYQEDRSGLLCPLPILVVQQQRHFLCAINQAFIFPGNSVSSSRQNCIVKAMLIGNQSKW